MNNFGTNNRKQLEEQFKNKFENAQFAPPAHLWEQIDAALDAKPWYKRPLFYWTSGLVAALLMVVMFWFTMFYENTNAPSDTIADSDKNKIENAITSIGTEKNAENTSSKTEETHNTSPNNTDNNNTESNSIQEKELVTNFDTKNTDSNFSTSDKNSTSSIDNSTINIDSNSDVVVATIPNDRTQDDKNTDIKTNVNSDKSIIETENTDLTEIVFKEIDWSKYLPVGNPYFEQEVIVKVDSTEEAIANSKTENSTKNTQKSSGIAITFGVNHTQGIYKPSFRTDSIHSGFTVIEAYSSNLADTLPQMNISGTYQQTGFDIALAFGKNQRWSINTGIAKGKATYSFSSTNYTLFEGSDIPTDQQPLVSHYNNGVEINYQWTQIPIAIGYQFGETKAKRFSGFAQLGTAIEFLNSYSYTSADPQFTYAIGTHRSTNTQVWTQAGINYHITNRFMIWGGGTYKSSLSSLINENGVTFSSQSYGWQVGTRFTIFKSSK